MNEEDPNACANSRAEAQLRRTAADWVARGHEGLGLKEQDRFKRWLAEDRRHRAVFAELEAGWKWVNRPRETGHADAIRCGLAAYNRRRSGRRRLFAWASVGVAASAMIAFLGLTRPETAGMADLAPSVMVRPDLRTLPDGSTVELNIGAEIRLEFTPAIRGVRLVRGEALFAVAKDPMRPFVVGAGAIAVKAVGTEFSVRYAPEMIHVLVTEGRVAVERTVPVAAEATPAPARPIFLPAGAKLAVSVATASVAPLKIEPISTAQIATALAWRGKRVEFTDTPLADAVALFNRENRIKLSIVPPSLAARSINGIFWSDDPEGFARLLEESLGLTAERTGERILLRSR